MKSEAKIFINYARDDQPQVEPVYQRLLREGFKPWMDKYDIVGGEKWKLAIKRAIRDCDFFMIFLSKNSVNKRGVLQKEIRTALENWKGMLENDIFLIPVRLEECAAPEILPSAASSRWSNKAAHLA